MRRLKLSCQRVSSSAMPRLTLVLRAVCKYSIRMVRRHILCNQIHKYLFLLTNCDRLYGLVVRVSVYRTEM
jgi:hypothetical protein